MASAETENVNSPRSLYDFNSFLCFDFSTKPEPAKLSTRPMTGGARQKRFLHRMMDAHHLRTVKVSREGSECSGD
jgi:hypothetical protein